VVINRGKSSEN